MNTTAATRHTTANANDLRTRRLVAGMTQQDLAIAADCSIGSVRLLETGYSPADSPTRERIERVLRELER